MSTAPKLKRAPRIFTVKAAQRITPNMIRVTLEDAAIRDIVPGCEGANCKLFLPAAGQSKEALALQMEGGPRPVVRTFTVRHLRPEAGEMDIDFVDHGDNGPASASAWARAATPGAFCGFGGPGQAKVTSFYADRYLIAADMSALPVAAAALEAMPRDAQGDAFFEIMQDEDRQIISAPKGIRQRWLINPNPHTPNGEMAAKVRALPVTGGTLQTCIAGESSMIKDLRGYLHNELKLPRDDTYISGYWKIGLVEDEHQKLKWAEAAA